MTNEQRNSWPLPEMPDEADDARKLPRETQSSDTAGEAGVVGAPPHPNHPSAHVLMTKQERYEAHRRVHAEAIGRPYPAERHAVWPR